MNPERIAEIRERSEIERLRTMNTELRLALAAAVEWESHRYGCQRCRSTEPCAAGILLINQFDTLAIGVMSGAARDE